MIGNIYFCADPFGYDKRFTCAHIAKSAVYTDKSNVRAVICNSKQFFVVKGVTAEIKRLTLSPYDQSKSLYRMVGKDRRYFEITKAYAFAFVIAITFSFPRPLSFSFPSFVVINNCSGFISVTVSGSR